MQFSLTPKVTDETLAPSIGGAAAAAREIQEVDPAAIRIGIHDPSRFEWVVSVPLPEDG